MAKSDIENMIEWKKRRGEASLTLTASYELQQIGEIWKSKGQDAPEFADFIPMRIVTVIEVFVREAIRELVDFGSPYLEQAEKLAKGAKIDFALLAGLQGRKLSVGDLIAHTVSTNEPTRIVAYLEALIPGFVEKLRTAHARWIEERPSWPLEPIIEDYNRMMAQLTRLFTVRHIVTHEIPREAAFDPGEIDGFFKAATEFVEATAWVLIETKQGAVPQTQAGMNEQAGDDLNRLEGEMKALVATILERGNVRTELLHESQAAWEAYATKEANLHASLVEGGSLYPTIWASAKAEEIRRRIEVLRWWAERQESDL